MNSVSEPLHWLCSEIRHRCSENRSCEASQSFKLSFVPWRSSSSKYASFSSYVLNILGYQIQPTIYDINILKQRYYAVNKYLKLLKTGGRSFFLRNEEEFGTSAHTSGTSTSGSWAGPDMQITHANCIILFWIHQGCLRLYCVSLLPLLCISTQRVCSLYQGTRVTLVT